MVWPLPMYVFITDRVRKAILENHLSGVRITAISELKKTDGFSPGRLRTCMPEGRARQLGEPLGIY